MICCATAAPPTGCYRRRNRAVRDAEAPRTTTRLPQSWGKPLPVRQARHSRQQNKVVEELFFFLSPDTPKTPEQIEAHERILEMQRPQVQRQEWDREYHRKTTRLGPMRSRVTSGLPRPEPRRSERGKTGGSRSQSGSTGRGNLLPTHPTIAPTKP